MLFTSASMVSLAKQHTVGVKSIILTDGELPPWTQRTQRVENIKHFTAVFATPGMNTPHPLIEPQN